MSREVGKLMTWRLTTIERDGQQCTAYAVKTSEEAREWARGLYNVVGTKLVVLVGSDGEIMIGDEILKWCRRKSSNT